MHYFAGLDNFINDEGMDVNAPVEDEEELVRICARVVIMSDAIRPKSLAEILQPRASPAYDVLRVHPVNPAAEEFAIMGLDELRANRPKRAVSYYLLCTEMAPLDKVYFMALGDAYLANDEVAAAINAFSHALALAPRWRPAMKAYIAAYDIKQRDTEQHEPETS